LFRAQCSFVRHGDDPREIGRVAPRRHQGDFGFGKCGRSAGAIGGGSVARSPGGSEFGLDRLAAGALLQFFGGRQRGFGATYKAVPAPEIAFARHETLACGKARHQFIAARTLDQTALRKTRAELGRRLNQAGQRPCALGHRGIDVGGAAGPVRGRIGMNRRVEIFGQRSGERALEARRADASDHRRMIARRLAQQTVEAGEFRFQFASAPLRSEQARRKPRLGRAGVIGGADGGSQRRLRLLRPRFGDGVLLAGFAQCRL
jgi:hypothetical protein